MASLSKVHRIFGERIREFRLAKNMTQEDLAFKIGVDRSYMGFLERGERNPTLEKIVKIANAVSKDPSELLRGLK